MASAPAQVSDDGMTITVHIRHGVHFSPPVNREVTSADVAYAIERGANPNVANPYFEIYFSLLEGFKEASGGPFPGITTPEQVHDRLPPDEAERADLRQSARAAAERGRAGRIRQEVRREETDRIRQLPGRDRPLHVQGRQRRAKCSGSATSRASPRRSCATRTGTPPTDFRPAYLDQINIQIGGDPNVIGRQVLEGSDWCRTTPPAQSIVQLAYEKFRTQLEISPGRRRPLHRASTTSRARSPTSTCARRSGRRSTAPR